MEETYEQLAALLQQQPERHFLIRRHDEPTVIGVTPYVKERKPDVEDIAAYKDKLLAQSARPAEIDKKLANMHQSLLLEARGTGVSSGPLDDFHPEDVWEKPIDNKGKT